MAWLGMPVVLAFPEITEYPLDLNYVATSKADYFKNVERAIAEGWSPEWIRKTYRWASMEYAGSLVSISESYRREEVKSLMSRVGRKLLRSLLPYHEQRADCRNRARRMSTAPRFRRILHESFPTPLEAVAEEPRLTLPEETALLRSEVQRLLAGFYGEGKEHPPNTLAGKLQHYCRGGTLDSGAGG
jgi:hypothetical protein